MPSEHHFEQVPEFVSPPAPTKSDISNGTSEGHGRPICDTLTRRLSTQSLNQEVFYNQAAFSWTSRFSDSPRWVSVGPQLSLASRDAQLWIYRKGAYLSQEVHRRSNVDLLLSLTLAISNPDRLAWVRNGAGGTGYITWQQRSQCTFQVHDKTLLDILDSCILHFLAELPSRTAHVETVFQRFGAGLLGDAEWHSLADWEQGQVQMNVVELTPDAFDFSMSGPAKLFKGCKAVEVQSSGALALHSSKELSTCPAVAFPPPRWFGGDTLVEETRTGESAVQGGMLPSASNPVPSLAPCRALACALAVFNKQANSCCFKE